MKKYDVLDLTKFILSFFVLAIHAYIFPHILYPWLRIAVPMYFVMSSFFLFSKIRITGEESRKAIVRNYITRQMKFYLFWFIALLPITVWTCSKKYSLTYNTIYFHWDFFSLTVKLNGKQRVAYLAEVMATGKYNNEYVICFL